MALALTAATLSLLFRDILGLLQSGLVRTLLSEGECRDVAGGMSPDYGTGILISAEKRDVLGRIGGEGQPRQEGAVETSTGGVLLTATGAPRPGGGEGEGSKGVDRWIVTTGTEQRIPPIPGLDHPNVMSYVDVLRRYVNVGNRVAIIGAGS